MLPFVEPDLDADDLRALCEQAYSTFRHPAVTPLVQLDHQLWVQELFHGPTLAFKDVALQLVGAMFDHVLGERGERVTIVGATSGDTGSAAIDARRRLRARRHRDPLSARPHERRAAPADDHRRPAERPRRRRRRHVRRLPGSREGDVQRRRVPRAQPPVRRELDQLGAGDGPDRVLRRRRRDVGHSANGPVTFSVPTGNFGNVLAGWIAREMGAPISDFVIASNTNDILTRFVNDGDMTTRDVVPTLSPSMDIQVSSNFERLLFEMNGRDGGMTAEQLGRFRAIGPARHRGRPARASTSTARSAPPSFDDAATIAEIAPHAGRDRRWCSTRTRPPASPRHGSSRPRAERRDRWSSLATAHPAKFPDAVEAATGTRPELPDHLADLFDRPERDPRRWPTTSTPSNGWSNSWSAADVASNGRHVG